MSTATSADTLPADDPVVEEAAEWLVRLSGEDAHSGDFAAFESWKKSDTRRAEAAERMCSLIERLSGLRTTTTGSDTRTLHATLDAIGSYPKKRPRSQLQRLGATLALVLTLALPSWLVLQKYPPAYLLADVRTAAGQPETRYLADSTELTMKGASAVNLRYDARQRTVELVRGEILLEVARDAQRPFVVETRHGSIRALGTRFAVRYDDNGTLLTMLESRTSVKATTSSGQNANELVVSAGQRVRIDAGGIGAIEPVNAGSIADAWRFNQLVVQNAPLPDVLDELARQRAGIIRYDRAALADIRVSAVLPLSDTDQALRLLSVSHHLRLTRLTPWLLSVALADKR
jgi:transmembrane sensor